MSTIAEWRTTLAGRLATVSGLRAYAKWPDKPTEKLPCAIVMPDTGPYDTFDDERTLSFTILVLADSVQNPAGKSQDMLDALLETGSIRDALDDGQVSVTGWRNYGRQDLGGSEYDCWGVEFSVEVLD